MLQLLSENIFESLKHDPAINPITTDVTAVLELIFSFTLLFLKLRGRFIAHSLN